MRHAALALMFAMVMTTGPAPAIADAKPSTALTPAPTKRSIATLLTATVPKGSSTTKRPALVLPSSTGEAKTARQTLAKERTQTLATPIAKPGKIVGGSGRPTPRTIVTKRIYP